MRLPRPLAARRWAWPSPPAVRAPPAAAASPGGGPPADRRGLARAYAVEPRPPRQRDRAGRGGGEAARLHLLRGAAQRQARPRVELAASRRDVPREVFSITKSVTSTLVGIAIRDGDLRLDDRVSRYVPQWRGTAVRDGARCATCSPTTAAASGRCSPTTPTCSAARSRTRYAVGLPQQYAPGSAWAYNNAAIQVLEPVLEKATGMPVARFARERLFEPLGMTPLDASSPTGPTTRRCSTACSTTCLDLARFGSLYLGEGKVDGTRLLDESYVTARRRPARPRCTTRPTATCGGSTVRACCAERPTRSTRRGSRSGRSPASWRRTRRRDVFAALGFGGQVLLVDPTTRTMVIRLGAPAQAGEEAYGFGRAATVLTEALR